jgi:hypothetical protein
MAVNIGSVISQFCEDNHIGIPDLAKKMGLSAPTISKMFHRTRLYADTIFTFSVILDHNFFDYYIGEFPEGHAAYTQQLQQELCDAKLHLDEMKRELEEVKK